MKELEDLVRILKILRLTLKISFIGLMALVILFSIAHMLILLNGGKMIKTALQDLTQRDVSIGHFDVSPFLDLEIKKLDIQGLGTADSVFISPSIPRFLMGRIAFNQIRLTRPKFIFEKSSPQTTENTAGASTSTPALKSKKKQPMNLTFKHIIIRDGQVDFTDRTAGENGIKITVKDIALDLTNVYLPPRSAVTNVELTGRIPWQQGQEDGKIMAEGWLNLYKKDMQADLRIEGIDGISLYPYYAKWVDLDKARIEKAKLNFISNLSSLNNDLTIKYKLELTDIVFKPRAPEEDQYKAERIAHAVIDMFKAMNQGKIVLERTIRTKMDHPKFDFGEFKLAFEDQLAKSRGKTDVATGVFMLPGKLVEGSVKSASDVSKAVIDGAFAVGIELKKALEAAFKKEKNE